MIYFLSKAEIDKYSVNVTIIYFSNGLNPLQE